MNKRIKEIATMKLARRLSLLAVLTAAALPAFAGAAQAAAPAWRLDSFANTNVAPGESFEYRVEATNVGDAETDGSQIVLTATLATGMTATEATIITFASILSSPQPCAIESPTEVRCETSATLSPFISAQPRFTRLNLTATAPPSEGLATTHFAVSGGGAPEGAATGEATNVTTEATSFGIHAFDSQLLGASGATFTQAAGHPAEQQALYSFNLATAPKEGPRFPVESVKDLAAELPPGILGNPAAFPQCTAAELIHGLTTEYRPECPSASQLGVALIPDVVDTSSGSLTASSVAGPVPIYNMLPPPGAPARFGFDVAGSVVVLDAHVRSNGDFGLTVGSTDIPAGLALTGSRVEFWGVPADEIHRDCVDAIPPVLEGPTCSAETEPVAFLRNTTSCTGPVSTVGVGDSWLHPGVQSRVASVSHDQPGFPYPPEEQGAPVGTTGCDRVPFNPGLSAQPTTNQADSPSGLDLHITVPQTCWQPEQQGSICQSDLRNAEVKLPQGMTLNPSAAGGLEACTPAQVGLTTPIGQSSPIHFNEEPVSCPDKSKIGEVTIATPLLEKPLTGAVYLAQQGQNPFGSLLAMYLVAEGSGVVVKQAGEIASDPNSGRLVTTFTEAPQTPFEDLHVTLFGGPRASLRTPPGCGSFAVTAKLTPWSGNAPVSVGNGFEIEGCANSGFSPKLAAGTQNPLAGSTSPFNLRLTREDGSQEIGGLTATLPPGLSGYLKGIAYCPDSVLASISGAEGTGAAQETHPGCPAASQVGTVTVGAGAGVNPFYTRSGRVYLAGPYKGAPLSLAVVAPAVAGPFDLGSVVVRNALQVNPETTQITAVSDPIPHILHGIPLDLRDVRIELNRPNFTLNPTSCEPMSIDAQVSSVQGQSADPSVRFQAAGCEKLAFKPKLALRFTGKTKRTGNPALHATLTMPQANEANISSARVTLPRGELIDNAHINNPCTRVQFNAGACPPSSILGNARAYSPLLDKPLEGPVYFRSNGGERELPDLVADLNGQIHVTVVGFIDAKKERIRNTFAVVPDAPVEKFTLSLFGGKRGLIENGHNLCKVRPKADAQFTAHNGKSSDNAIAIKLPCGGKKHGGRRGR
jgi:hypothetical protein